MISTEGGLGPPDSSACMGNEDASFARKAFAEWLVGGIGPPQEKVASSKQNFCRSKVRSSMTLLSLWILCLPKNVIATLQLCQILDFPHKTLSTAQSFNISMWTHATRRHPTWKTIPLQDAYDHFYNGCRHKWPHWDWSEQFEVHQTRWCSGTSHSTVYRRTCITVSPQQQEGNSHAPCWEWLAYHPLQGLARCPSTDPCSPALLFSPHLLFNLVRSLLCLSYVSSTGSVSPFQFFVFFWVYASYLLFYSPLVEFLFIVWK